MKLEQLRQRFAPLSTQKLYGLIEVYTERKADFDREISYIKRELKHREKEVKSGQ